MELGDETINNFTFNTSKYLEKEIYDEYIPPYWYSWKLQVMSIQQEIALIFMGYLGKGLEGKLYLL